MEPLSEEFVEKTWRETAGLSSDMADREMRAMGKNQPDLLAFLMTFSEDLGREAQELAVYLGFVVYRMFMGSGVAIPRITSRMLMAEYNKNARLLKGLEGSGEGSIADAVAEAGSAAQPHIMKYVLDSLMEGSEEDDIELGEGDIALLFVLLKTEIEVLDGSSSLSKSSRRLL
ncbi:MAG TPA: hypothetical protein VMH06_04470 [Thermodesulfovibrionales bacterium]|nr:hypothetical protein [Thermodesulfovibrionales bacterium]